MLRTNHIFIDYENIREFDLDRIANRPVKVTLVLGEQHTKLPTALVKQLHKYAGQVELIETGRSGKNALDLVLAVKLGEQLKSDPMGYFHILSGDTDFDPLVGYLRDNKSFAARHKSFSEIPVLMNLAERVKLLGALFAKESATRPKKREKLEALIHAIFARVLSPEEIAETLQGMVKAKIIGLNHNGEVTFPNPN